MLFRSQKVVHVRVQSYLCRTQLEIRLDTDVDDFLENALGNHHVIVFDDISEELRDFCRFRGIEIIT